MNLREKFIWNVLVGFSFVSIAWFGWDMYNKNSITNKLYDKFKNEQVGTDQSLQDKVNSLESVYKYHPIFLLLMIEASNSRFSN